MYALSVVTIGTIGYRLAGLEWLDALYQTVISVTTVGYTDLAPDNKGFTIVIVVFGTLMLAVLISVITGAFVDRFRFGSYLVFIALWSIIVYSVLAHSVWGGGLWWRIERPRRWEGRSASRRASSRWLRAS